MRLESSLRAPPGLVKLRQKIQLHTTKLKPSDYVGFSKLPYQVRKTKQRYQSSYKLYVKFSYPQKVLQLLKLICHSVLCHVNGVNLSVCTVQVYRRAVKRGFSFNLMLAGESGLGKASLINSMFLADVCQKKVIFPYL